MMRPEIVMAIINSANVMKTPEKPKANTLKAMVQSITGSSSLKNGKIVHKASSNYNRFRADFVRIFSNSLGPPRNSTQCIEN